MRAKGASLREIAFDLGVSLSSASVWVRHIPRGEHQAAERDEPDVATASETAEPKPVKRCGKCRKDLPESAFNRHPTGRQWWCRECFRAYFKKRGDLHREQSAAAKQKRQATALAFVADYKARNPCVDCGEASVEVLEFDHIAGKRWEVSVLPRMGASIPLLKREIEKCDIVCVNCHRRRTGLRGGWRRAHKPWWRSPPPKRYETARNLAFAYSYLERSGCLDCGEADLCVLDFDHRTEKNGLVTVLAREGVSLRRLQEEIALCDVRCGNCHRHRTWRQRRQRRR